MLFTAMVLLILGWMAVLVFEASKEF